MIDIRYTKTRKNIVNDEMLRGVENQEITPQLK